MKRIPALLIAILLLCCSALAEEEDWYLKTARELTTALGELAADDGYLQTMSSQTFACMDEFRQTDFENIISAWRYSIPPVKEILPLFSISDGADMGKAAMDYLNARFPATIITMYGANYGVENVAATAMLTYSRTYVMPDHFDPCILTLELDRGAVGVAFFQSGEDTITASISPLFGDADASPAEIATDLGSVLPALLAMQIF